MQVMEWVNRWLMRNGNGELDIRHSVKKHRPLYQPAAASDKKASISRYPSISWMDLIRMAAKYSS